MNRKEIMEKLLSDMESTIYLMKQQYASDGKVALQSKLDYIESILEWITQGGKV
jgi:hypothetical protein